MFNASLTNQSLVKDQLTWYNAKRFDLKLINNQSTSYVMWLLISLFTVQVVFFAVPATEWLTDENRIWCNQASLC